MSWGEDARSKFAGPIQIDKGVGPTTWTPGAVAVRVYPARPDPPMRTSGDQIAQTSMRPEAKLHKVRKGGRKNR